MANPAVITCTKNVWVLVATAVLSGTIEKLSDDPGAYVQTYRLTGQAAPTNDDDAGPLFTHDDTAEIAHTAAIDVYVKAKTRAGKVRVDL